MTDFSAASVSSDIVAASTLSSPATDLSASVIVADIEPASLLTTSDDIPAAVALMQATPAVIAAGATCPLPLSIVAVALTPYSVQINFSELMVLNGELSEAENYTITGPGSPQVLLVTPEVAVNPTYVVLTTTEHLQSGAYVVSIERTQSILEGVLTDGYTGLGDAPQFASATALSARLVEVCFDERMSPAALSVVANWTIDEDLGSNVVTVIGVTFDDPSQPLCAYLELNTDMTEGVANYQVQVPASTFLDVVGNPQIAPFFIDYDGIGIPDVIAVPDSVQRDGGYRVQVSGSGLTDGTYFVYVGTSASDPQAIGEDGHREVTVADESFVIYTPILDIGGPYEFHLVRITGTGAVTITTAPVLSATPVQFRSSISSLRGLFPSWYSRGLSTPSDAPPQV